MSWYKNESSKMWRYMPKRDAKRMLLNEGFCLILKNDINGEKAFLSLLIKAARINARRAPPKKV